MSIINHKGSRGYPNLYEIGVFSDCDTMTALPGITEQNDQVKGNLTPNEVDVIILKMIAITGKRPVSVLPPNLELRHIDDYFRFTIPCCRSFFNYYFVFRQSP